MGCHTWFSRPMTEEEFQWMKEWAVNDVIKCCGDTEYNRRNCKSDIDLYLVEAVKKSVRTGDRCCYGYMWYELGYGSGNPKFVERDGCRPDIDVIENKVFVNVCFNTEYAEKEYGMSYEEFIKTDIWEQLDFPYFHDVFRIHNYPRKIIHSRRELRKYLRRRYFDLSEWQLKRISKFFELYPGGVITFG